MGSASATVTLRGAMARASSDDKPCPRRPKYRLSARTNRRRGGRIYAVREPIEGGEAVYTQHTQPPPQHTHTHSHRTGAYGQGGGVFCKGGGVF
eukprot:1712763-Pyramimonas_sp.AAC.2